MLSLHQFKKRVILPKIRMQFERGTFQDNGYIYQMVSTVEDAINTISRINPLKLMKF